MYPPNWPEPIPPEFAARGWHSPSQNRVVRIGGLPTPEITAELHRTFLEWVGVLHRPPRTLIPAHEHLAEALEAFEAAERDGPRSQKWADRAEAEIAILPGWVYGRTKDGRDRWAAFAYGRHV